MRSQDVAGMQDFHRRLLQIDDSATTVNAAPLANANATSSVTPSSSSDDSHDDSPHTILEDVISAYKAKFGKGPAPAPVTVSATANATASAGSDSDSSDLYSTPCSSDPIPTQYEAFVEVCCYL